MPIQKISATIFRFNSDPNYDSILEITVLDETQFSNPKSFDYHFDDDMKAFADTNDIYDELVPYLPRFVIYKNGRDAGYTRVSFFPFNYQ